MRRERNIHKIKRVELRKVSKKDALDWETKRAYKEDLKVEMFSRHRYDSRDKNVKHQNV